MKKYLIISFLFIFTSSCNILSDEDNDGISNYNNYIQSVYDYRTKYTFSYVLRKFKTESCDNSYSDWYKDSSPIYVNYYGSSFTKNEIQYSYQERRTDNAFMIYKIANGVNIDKYVVVTIEPTPMCQNYSAFLLISKMIFDTITEARTYSQNAYIPKLYRGYTFIDLVFDPDSIPANYTDNISDHAKAVIQFDLLEIFGRDSYVKKKTSLSQMGYEELFK